MLRLNRLTDYACALMQHLARKQEIQKASEIARVTQINLPTINKLLKQLAKAGLVQSQQGVNGGYALARPATQITLLDIINATEESFGITRCTRNEACERQTVCDMKKNWNQTNQIFSKMLKNIRLVDWERH
ncbi:MAG: SUF system Fe-S cluster assembly regulator [Gammaproteobacteria bacterium RIFCSPHIGHO2_02_FULL_42_13]|nr:MAG: SUF system Fe-S cluster assembly regulator [Gammaproteobacteria bacterium RIFCSPHIGHO2_02_FULL_42_13]